VEVGDALLGADDADGNLLSRRLTLMRPIKEESVFGMIAELPVPEF